MFHLLLGIIYLAFISLGLPDSLLGSAWPAMYPEFGVPVSYAGIVSMIISCGTIFSSLQSDRLTKRFGPGWVTAVSVLLTAVALFGFSASPSFLALCLWAVPYGLGAGSVDASLNNYVALHYASRHMSWLHCMWGVGASAGPYIMGYALTGGQSWGSGYRYIAFLQVALTAVLFISLPLWTKAARMAPAACTTGSANNGADNSADNSAHGSAGGDDHCNAGYRALSLPDIFRIPGAKEVIVTFFCYCALEQTAGLWASSYLVLRRGLSTEEAAGFASLFYVGITAGRALSGFLTLRFSDTRMIRLGQWGIAAGILCMLLPLGTEAPLLGLILAGLGCAPIYPSIIHSTPAHFGADRSQAMIGVQMASAYVGSCLMPPVFGYLANHISAALLPFYLLAILALMIGMHEKMLRKLRVRFPARPRAEAGL
ncbi:MFS transporter [uncultured Merdimonas sp.]|uniref:MFS transporter n=1 Tax=uncultured Merdimonas sp. TaxID=2023269 RepID=UPI0032084C7E